MWMIAAWQGLQNDSISSGNTRLLMIFVGVVSISMLAQAVVVIVVAIGAKKTEKRILAIAESLHMRANPILESTEQLTKDLVPKIKTISENLLQTSYVVRAKAQEFDSTLTDVNKKTKAQVARVDSMISTALTATGALAEMVHRGIRVPVVEAVGVVNGFKAGIDSFMGKSGTNKTDAGKTNGFGGTSQVAKKTAMTVYKSEDDASL